MTAHGADTTTRAAVWAVARAHDNERYLAALLAPAEVRDDLMALAAFAGEVQRIPLTVSEPMIGEIRLQWWRDALPALARGEITGNPTADALGATIRRHDLPQGLVMGLLEARSFDLYADPMPDEQAFRAYLGKTEGALVELALRVLHEGSPGAAAGTAIAAGQAIGLARVLGGLPHMLARGRCVLPASRLGEAGVGLADLVAMPVPASVPVLMAGFVRDARTALALVRADWSRLPGQARLALLPVAVIEPQLRGFEQVTHHPGRDISTVMPLTRIWRIWSALVLGRL